MTFPIAIHITGRDDLVLRAYKTLKDAREQARRLAHEGILVEQDSVAVASADPPDLPDVSMYVDAFYPPHRIERIDILTMEAVPDPEPEPEPDPEAFSVSDPLNDPPPALTVVHPDFDSALYDALLIGDGCDRWDALARSGATDAQIKATLGDLWTQSPKSFALGLVNSTRYGYLGGGDAPAFLPFHTPVADAIEGPPLIAKVRALFQIGEPAIECDADDGDPTDGAETPVGTSGQGT